MPLQATSGAASYDAFGGGVAAVPNYIEDVFSTWLYNGDTGGFIFASSGVSIVSGGMMWVKSRDSETNNFIFSPSLTSANHYLNTNTTAAQSNSGISNNNFEAVDNGGGMRFGGAYSGISSSATGPFVSWTFRKQPKFYTQGTFTGTGSVQNITHDLGSVPGFIIVKDTTNNGSAWAIYHTSLGNTKYLQFTTDAAGTSSGYWNNTSPTSTQFTVGTNGNVNQSGATYVYYAFAHDAGGFGLTGTDNVISCGSYTGNGSATGPTVNLGYEPQWLMVKASSSDPGYASNRWTIIDNMRGWPSGPNANSQWLIANTSDSEQSGRGQVANMTSTGFTVGAERNDSGVTFIYIAIRRGPMKVPTSGTSVFSPIAVNATTGTAQTTNFRPDMQLLYYRDGADPVNTTAVDRLRGVSTNTTGAGQNLKTSSTVAEGTSSPSTTLFWNNTGFQVPGMFANSNSLFYSFQRAPSTFDEVCYTGNATSGSTQTHNLGVAPEFMIVKGRSVNANWFVYSQALGATKYLVLNDTGGSGTLSSVWNDTSPTSTQFTLGNAGAVNASGGTYVAYLWATNPGVTKVGSYTGNGSSQTINCGFTGGSRLVLIIRTDASGDRYIWDSARGIVSGNDPHLSLNSTAAEVTTDDTIDTDSTGFIVNQVSATNCNVSGANYIFLSYA